MSTDTDNIADDETSDDTSSGLKLWADVGLEIGKGIDGLNDSTKKLTNKLEKNTPVDYAAVISGVAVTGNPLLLILGAPDAGTFWEVESIAIGGVDYVTTAAGSAGVYVSAYPALAGAGLGNLADIAVTMPFIDHYGNRKILVNEGEYLFVIVNSGTNGQTYVANAQVTVYDDRSSSGDVVTIN